MDVLPQFRESVQISVHTEGDERYLVIHDPFGYADGGILLSIDMLEVLELCDGTTTYDDLAKQGGVAVDSQEIIRVKMFLGELSQMGFMEDDVFEARKARIDLAWNANPVRLPVCAGNTYPADSDECRSFIRDMLGNDADEPDSNAASMAGVRAILAPHIDFNVAPNAYGPSFAPVQESDAELFVIIGTSHYWMDDALVLTDKHFRTPLGDVTTDTALVHELRRRLGDIVSDTDVAHRPEHSIELHAVILKSILGDKPFSILPILVADIDNVSEEEIDRVAGVIRDVVAESGKKALWLISGDMSHVGPRFGDTEDARRFLASIRDIDAQLLECLENGDVHSWYRQLHENNATRICGYGPVTLGLKVAEVRKGTLHAYDVWDDDATESAVTFAGMWFTR